MEKDKDEFPPLLEAGFHEKTVEQLRALCVDARRFQKSTSRARLMDRLSSLIGSTTRLGIVGEFWIDGSFLTEKLDPKDVDLSLRIQASVYDQGTPEQIKFMDWLTEIHDTEQIDGYLQLEFPVDDPNYALGISNHDYWKKQWGISRTGVPKGIAVVKLPRRSK